MKKVFIIAGELSGDRTAAWYLQKRKQQSSALYWEGVGGDFMQREGVKLVERLEALNLVGGVEIVKHLPRILKFMRWLVAYIVHEKFDEIVLVDFPGFNMRLAALLKKKMPGITVTYVAPPQLWCWGAWRVKKLKKLGANLVVLYPFEVSWYKQRGIDACWLGCPVYDALESFLRQDVPKQPLVALMPGSREGEIVRLLPLLIDVATVLHQKYPQIRFIIPVAASLAPTFMAQQLGGLASKIQKLPVTFIVDDNKKYEVLSSCCLAITKPGTVTLELALLKIPAVVFFKISWITYAIARCVAQVTEMALPNLLLNKIVYPECIQRRCTVEQIVKHADVIINSYLGDRSVYQSIEASLEPLRTMLRSK